MYITSKSLLNQSCSKMEIICSISVHFDTIRSCVSLQAFLQSGAGEKCNIVCTEPRRVSAISLATRVSDELGDLGPGEKGSFCGYQIRFESVKCETTRLLYCTTGVLLRKLQLDPLLKDVTHIIVDEVRENFSDVRLFFKSHFITSRTFYIFYFLQVISFHLVTSYDQLQRF